MKRAIPVLVICFALLTAGTKHSVAQGLIMRDMTPESLLGMKAPDISGDLLGGGKFNLADYQGKNIVIIDFWATWCGPCRMSMPILIKAAQDYKEKGVVLFGINQGDSPGEIAAFQEDTKLLFNVVLDKYGAIGSAYGVENLPVSMIVNKEGIVEAVHLGASMELKEIIKKQLDILVAGKSLLRSTVPDESTKTPEKPPATPPTAPPALPADTPPPVKAETATPVPPLPKPTPLPAPPAAKPEIPSSPKPENVIPVMPVAKPIQIGDYVVIAFILLGLALTIMVGLGSRRKHKH